MKNNIFLLSILIPIITGCAGTSKTLSSNKVFAPSCSIADLTTRKNPDFINTDLSNSLESIPNTEDPEGLYPRCAQKESIYSNAVWFPVLGPLYDLSTNTNPRRSGIWYFLSTALPIIGPMAQLSYGAKQCISECMPPPETIDINKLPAYFDRAMNLSDENCGTFLSRFSAGMNGANESKDTLNSISTITATGAAFANPLAGAIISGTKTILSDSITSYSNNYLQSKLMTDLLSSIQEFRKSARTDLAKSPRSVEEVVAKVNSYDALCSIDSAVLFMQKAVNALKASQKTKDGSNEAITVTGTAPAAPAAPAAPTPAH